MPSRTPAAKNDTTAERILDAARGIFQRKGLSGARMQEIADAVGINKSMLHYHFETKEKLFEAVFDEAVATLTAVVVRVLESDLPLREKLETFVAEYLEVLLEKPHIPAFVLGELNHDAARITGMAKGFRFEAFVRQLTAEARAGKIRATDPRRLVIDLMSLCVFPFAARPMLEGAFGLDDRGFRQLIEGRKREIPDLLLRSLAP